MGWKGESRRHSLSRKGIKTNLPDGRRFDVSNYVAKGKRIEIDWDKGYLTEKEIQLIKNRMNKGEDVNLEYLYEGGISITPEQTKKGIDWLIDKWKTPRGIERKNNPFGYREQAVLDNFDHFKLIDFYNVGNTSFDNYVPYYRVVAKDGSYFEYAFGHGGEIRILG